MMKKTKYSKWQLYWQLFYVFLKISFFGFGGGNAVMPLIKNEVVVKKRWITEDEFNHLLILANTIPGPSIFQVSASVGYKIAGIIGALLASFVAYLPNMIAFIFLATLLFKYIDIKYLYYINLAILPVILALLTKMIFKMLRNSMKELSLTISIPIIFLCVGYLALTWQLNLWYLNFPAVVIIISCLVTILYNYLRLRQKHKPKKKRGKK